MILPSIAIKVKYHYINSDRMRTETQNDACRVSSDQKSKYCSMLVKCHNYMQKRESNWISNYSTLIIPSDFPHVTNHNFGLFSKLFHPTWSVLQSEILKILHFYVFFYHTEFSGHPVFFLSTNHAAVMHYSCTLCFGRCCVFWLLRKGLSGCLFHAAMFWLLLFVEIFYVIIFASFWIHLRGTMFRSNQDSSFPC